MSEVDQKLECAICGMKSNNLVTHITRTHKISCDEYKKVYNSPVMQHTAATKEYVSKIKTIDESKRQKILKNAQQNILEVSHLEPLKCRLCEFTSGLSIISHITRTHKFDIIEYRKTWPNDTVQRTSKSIREKVSSSVKKWFKHDENYQKMLSARSFPSELKHWTRKGFDIETAKQKVIEFQRFANSYCLKNPIQRSKGEIELAEFCTQLQPDIQFNQHVDRYNVDILSTHKRVIIEYFGDFWHMNPMQWSQEMKNPVTGFTAKFTWDRDAVKVKRLNDLNYNVISIWEYDWKYNRNDCQKRIKQCLT